MDHDFSSLLKIFQNLCCTGKRATLSFSCENGKTSVNLKVDIDEMKPVMEYPPPVTPISVSPSRKRRMIKRAEARRLFAAEANANLSPEEQDVLCAAATAVISNSQGFSTESKHAMSTDNEVSSSDIAAQVDEPAENETEEVNLEEVVPEEVKRDRMVDQLVVYCVSGGSIFKRKQYSYEVEREVTEKLAAMGVEVKNFSSNSDNEGKY